MDRTAPSPQGTGIGELLRSRRQALGITLEQVHAETRIPVRYLQALEEERFEAFPAVTYARGFLRTYAQFLELDPESLLVHLPAPVSSLPPSALSPARTPVRPARQKPRWRRLLQWSVTALTVGLLVVGYVAYREFRAFLESTSPSAPSAFLESKPTPAPPVQVLSPAPSPPTPEEVRVALEAEDVSWVRVVVDGRRVFEGFLRTGERREWSGRSRIHVVLGNAGGVRVEVNGRDLGRLGGRGEVVRRTFTVRDGAR